MYLRLGPAPLYQSNTDRALSSEAGAVEMIANGNKACPFIQCDPVLRIAIYVSPSSKIKIESEQEFFLARATTCLGMESKEDRHSVVCCRGRVAVQSVCEYYQPNCISAALPRVRNTITAKSYCQPRNSSR